VISNSGRQLAARFQQGKIFTISGENIASHIAIIVLKYWFVSKKWWEDQAHRLEVEGGESG